MKKQTRQNTAKKAAAPTKKAAAPTKKEAPLIEPKPMDTSIGEKAVGTPHAARERNAYALTTLVAEVHHLFPEVPVEYSGKNPRGVHLSATFDATTLDPQDRDVLYDLLLLATDERLGDVVIEHDAINVTIQNNPRTQDSREPFGLNEAYMVLIGYDEGGSE